jgi:hypothetical protein
MIHGGKNSKSQVPNPIFESQPLWPSLADRYRLVAWEFSPFGISLELGVWDLELSNF